MIEQLNVCATSLNMDESSLLLLCIFGALCIRVIIAAVACTPMWHTYSTKIRAKFKKVNPNSFKGY